MRMSIFPVLIVLSIIISGCVDLGPPESVQQEKLETEPLNLSPFVFG